MSLQAQKKCLHSHKKARENKLKQLHVLKVIDYFKIWSPPLVSYSLASLSGRIILLLGFSSLNNLSIFSLISSVAL